MIVSSSNCLFLFTSFTSSCPAKNKQTEQKNNKQTRLSILFWEIKSRLFYILLSFFLSFLMSYQNSKSLFYLFVLSYKKINDHLFTASKDVKQSFRLENGGSEQFLQTISQENMLQLYGDTIDNVPLSVLLYFYKIVKFIDIEEISFIFTDVDEAFSSTLFICFIFSFAMVVPILIYEVFSFLAPSLHVFEKKKWFFRVFGVTSIWYFFLYNVQSSLIPKLAEFLLQFQISNLGFSIIGQTKISSYCAWAISIFIATNFIFFLFCVLFFCVINQTIDIQYFTARRKIWRAVLLLLSALIAPPEIQLVLAVIALFCFELGIGFFFFYKRLSLAR